MSNYKFYTHDEVDFMTAYPQLCPIIDKAFEDKQLDKSNFYFGEGLSIELESDLESLEIYYINESNEHFSLSFDITMRQDKIQSIDNFYGEN